MARCQADTETAKHVPGMPLPSRTCDGLLLERISGVLRQVSAASRRVISDRHFASRTTCLLSTPHGQRRQ
jgi:hypothetical protein